MFKSREEFAIAMAKGEVFTRVGGGDKEYIYYMESVDNGSSPFVFKCLSSGAVNIMLTSWIHFNEVVPYIPWNDHIPGTWPDCKTTDQVEVKYAVGEVTGKGMAGDLSWITAEQGAVHNSSRDIIRWRPAPENLQ